MLAKEISKESLISVVEIIGIVQPTSIERLEMCTKHMILKHIKISLTSKVYSMDPPVYRYDVLFFENSDNEFNLN